MEIVNALKNIFENKNVESLEEKEFCFNIGISSEILTRHSGYTAHYNGKFIEIVPGSSHKWRRFVTDIKINPLREPNPHVLIVGMSGFGKSTLFKSMIIDIKNFSGNAIIFDAHNEHEKIVGSLGGKIYDAGACGINIFELCGLTISERIAELTRLFTNVYGLGYIQATKLSECLWYTYRKLGAVSKNDKTLVKVPNVSDLTSELTIFIKNANTAAEMHTLEHLRARLSLLNSSSFGKNSVSIEDVKSGISSFSLADLKSGEAQIIYIHELLRRLYSTMKERTKEQGVSLYIMLDEAQFLIRSSDAGGEIISNIISEGRKYGVGVVIATHLSSTLDKRIVSNASTFITFYARDPSEVNYVSSMLSGGDTNCAILIKLKLRKMKQNCALVLSNIHNEPVIVDTPRFSTLEGGDNPTEGNAARIFVYARKPVTIESVYRFGKEFVDDLINKGELDSITVDDAGRKETWVMRYSGAVSVEHELYVMKLRDVLAGSGLKFYVLNNWSGADVIVYKDNYKIAVEYETGKKTHSETRKMLEQRLKTHEKVFIIVNDAHFEQYSEHFSADKVVVMKTSDYRKLPERIG